MSKKHYWRSVAALFCLLVLGWSVLRTVGWLQIKNCKEEVLDTADARWVALLDDRTWESFGPDSLLTTDGDAQLIWTVDGLFTGLQMTVRASKPVTQPELYYTIAPGQDFSASRKLEPAMVDPAAGVYVFWMDKLQYVYDLRLDPTIEAGSFLQLSAVLNPSVSAADWFLPSPVQLLTLFAAPPLAVLAVDVLVIWAKTWRRVRNAPTERN